MTPVESAAAFVALTLVLLCGTHGTHIGTAMCLLGAWWHEPPLVAIGVLFCYASQKGRDDGGDSGRPRHA